MRPLSRPRRARPVVALAALAALAACGDGDATVLAVELSVDGSCGQAPASAVGLSCDATVGVWLLDGDTGAVLDQACVPYGSGPTTLADLPATLADAVAFTGVTAPRIRLELAIFGPARSECPRQDGVGAGAVVFGRSGLVETASDDRIALVLSCGVSGTGDGDPQCAGACDAGREECYATFGQQLEQCQFNADQCRQACGEEPFCLDICDQNEVDCIEQAGDCEGQYDRCLEGCATGELCVAGAGAGSF